VSNVHALQDVLRYLNSHDFKRESVGAKQVAVGDYPDFYDRPLQITGDAIIADYATLRLSSRFQPITTVDGTAIGYKAYLRAASNATRNYNLDISKLALAAIDRREIVYLDRLTRTLHALNYLAQDLNGDLHMSVNPKHLLEVHGNHGAVFEQILSKCGLETNRIVLEISEYVSNKEHLQIAIDGWRQRRYKIAFDNFTPSPVQIARVLKHKPDIVKIDISSLYIVAGTTEARQLLEDAIEQFGDEGIEAVATHIDDVEDYETAKCYGFAALQGAWLKIESSEQLLQKVAF